MMTEATPKDYWIAENALFIARNTNSNPDCIQAACSSGAQILVYVKGIIGYDAGHNYQRWQLQASPTVFGTHTEKYVYAAIPRPDTDRTIAIIVFPSERIDIYGKNAAEEQVGSTDYYYVFLQGILTSSGDNGTIDRIWKQEIVTGYLASDEAINAGPTESAWYEYSPVDNRVTFLKDMTMKEGTLFEKVNAHQFDVQNVAVKPDGKITFNKGNEQIEGVATTEHDEESTTKIATPQFIAERFLSKKHADTAEAEIRFLQGLISDEMAKFLKGVQLGPSFASGITGTGGRIDANGIGELDALTLRKWLEVPELRYNRVEVIVGTQWRSPGGGIIESVVPDANGDTQGIAYLKLEDGEIGKIAEGDICMGVWHNAQTASVNATDEHDDSKGNFRFSGFCTIYFRVAEVLSVDGGQNNAFRYVLRPQNTAYPTPMHPAAMMHFVCYGNFSDTTRQQSRYSTLTYERYLAHVNNWEFTEANIMAQFGDLSNLSVFGLNMTGYSAYLNNIYMSGTIQQFDQMPLRMEVSNSLDGFLAFGETCTLSCRVMKGWTDLTQQVTSWTISRSSGDAASDKAWGMKQKVTDFKGSIDIAFTQAENDLGSAVSSLFTITANLNNEQVIASIEI